MLLKILRALIKVWLLMAHWKISMVRALKVRCIELLLLQTLQMEVILLWCGGEIHGLVNHIATTTWWPILLLTHHLTFWVCPVCRCIGSLHFFQDLPFSRGSNINYLLWKLLLLIFNWYLWFMNLLVIINCLFRFI